MILDKSRLIYYFLNSEIDRRGLSAIALLSIPNPAEAQIRRVTGILANPSHGSIIPQLNGGGYFSALRQHLLFFGSPTIPGFPGIRSILLPSIVHSQFGLSPFFPFFGFSQVSSLDPLAIANALPDPLQCDLGIGADPPNPIRCDLDGDGLMNDELEAFSSTSLNCKMVHWLSLDRLGSRMLMLSQPCSID